MSGAPAHQGNIATAMLSVSSPGTHFGDGTAARALAREVNDFGASLKRDHPGRFGRFASLPLPDVEGSLAELTHALDELGSDGVTLESNSEGLYLGNERYQPLWAELDRRKAFGSERLLYGSDYCWTPAGGTTAQIASVDAADQPAGDTWRALATRNAGRLFPGPGN